MEMPSEFVEMKLEPKCEFINVSEENSEIQNEVENVAEEENYIPTNVLNSEQFQEDDGHHVLSGHFMFPTESTSETPTEKEPPKIIGKPVHVCFHCNKYFTSQITLLRHCKIYHFCKYCNIQFSNYDNFYIHNLETHTNLEYCKLCNREFNSLQDRYEHIGRHTYVLGHNYNTDNNYKTDVSKVNTNVESTELNNDISDIFNCDLCNKEINSEEVHICPNTICIACNLKFESEDEFLNHIEEIHICKNICNHCYLQVRSAESHINHIKTCIELESIILKNLTFEKKLDQSRTNPKKHKCKYCPIFLSKIKMEKHMIQNHQCLHCTKKFETQKLLVFHLLVVGNPGSSNPFLECQICNKDFKTKNFLNYHFRKYHLSDDDKDYTNCKSCREKILNTKDSINIHKLKCRNGFHLKRKTTTTTKCRQKK